MNDIAAELAKHRTRLCFYQLYDSIGQSNRVLIHLTVNYKAGLLALSVKHYFEQNKEAIEVLIFKGRKVISVSRELSESKLFYGLFMKKYYCCCVNF